MAMGCQYHTTRPRRHLATYVAMGALALYAPFSSIIVTSQGRQKCPPEEQTQLHWPVETLCIADSSCMSIAMILFNKVDFSVGANIVSFCRDSHK